MATSTEKIISTIILFIICIFIFFQIIPLIFMGSHLSPPSQLFLGASGLFLLVIKYLPFILLALLIIWLGVIIWVYWDAERRGMSGLLWALLVLFGNLVGFIIYLIVRNNELPRQLSTGASEPCPYCAKTVAKQFVFCPHCGTRLKALCPSCEKAIACDWQVCPYCGVKLTQDE